MAGFQRRHDALGAIEGAERRQGFGIRRRGVADTPQVLQVGVFGAHARVVQPRGNRVGFHDLAVVRLHQVSVLAVQHTGRAGVERRRVAIRFQPQTRGFDAGHVHAGVVQERMEEAHGVGAAADAGDQQIRQAAFRFKALGARFRADDGLEIAHHHGVRVRPGHGADDVVRGIHVGHPIPHGLVHGVLQRAGAGFDRHHLGAEQLHAIHVQALPFDVRGAHEHPTFKPQPRRHRRRRHAMLPGASFRDDARLAHALRKQRLPHRVVDLVGAGVVQVLPLEVQLGAADLRRQAFGQVERRGAPDVVGQIVGQFGAEARIVAQRLVEGRQLLQGLRQRFRDEAAAMLAEPPAGVRRGVRRIIARRHDAPP